MSGTALPTALGFSRRRVWRLPRHVTLIFGATALCLLATLAILAPVLAPYDPIALDVVHRLRPPSGAHWFGTDAYGRDVLSRTLYGGRISLVVGIAAALASAVIGATIGVLAAMFGWANAVLMRLMDGLMAIPAILLAVAMMSLARPGILTVVVAITIPEIPRVARLVRSVVMIVRQQPYVLAATSIGTKLPGLLLRHVLPNALTPLVVQATYVCASAVLLESYLGFLGVGIPPETPSWGNVIADGRTYVQLAIWIVLFPGLFLGLMVMAINMLGDGVRDLLDPRLSQRV